RIIADHLRAAAFLIADGVLPSKEDRGYVLRRILRRAIRYGKLLGVNSNFLIPIAQTVIKTYQDIYPELSKNSEDIMVVVAKEEEKFGKTLEQGLKRFEKLVQEALDEKKTRLNGEDVFHLYDTYGFPIELTKELAEEKGLQVDEKGFAKAFSHHQEISRAGVEKKFGGVGEFGQKAAPQHTATHLLHQALRDVLGERVQQAGSDLTLERLRFDFTHLEKLTDEQKKKVEDIVNQKIKENLLVKMEEMPYQKALDSGALAFFKEKYPETVKVYS
ncbi:unnamed protein product, partial [marine sediment metagenome]